MASPYDALLEAPTETKRKSQYDALLEAPSEDSGSPAYNPRNEQISAAPSATGELQKGNVLNAGLIGVGNLSRLLDPIMAPGQESGARLLSPEVAKAGANIASYANPFGLVSHVVGGEYRELVKSAEDAVAENLSNFSSLEGIASLPALGVRPAQAIFAGSVLSKLPEQYGRIKDAISEHGLLSAPTVKAAVDAGTQDLMAVLAIKGASAGKELLAPDESAKKPAKAPTAIAPAAAEVRAAKPLLETAAPEAKIVTAGEEPLVAPEPAAPEVAPPVAPEVTAPVAPEVAPPEAPVPVQTESLTATEGVKPTSEKIQKNEAQRQGQETDGGLLAAPEKPSVQPAEAPAASENVLSRGKLGETHGELADNIIKDPNATVDQLDAAIEAGTNDKLHGFYDSAGNELNRSDAAQVALKAGQIKPEFEHLYADGKGELQSQHLQEATKPGPKIEGPALFKTEPKGAGIEATAPSVEPQSPAMETAGILKPEADFVKSQADAARQNFAMGAASAGEFPFIREQSARDYAAIGAQHILEGAGDRASWEAAMREEYGIRDASPAELNKIWKDSNEFLKDFRESQTGKAAPVKTQIERATGVRPTLGTLKEQMANSVSKAQAFAEYLRGLAKGAKEGFKKQRAQLAIADKWLAADQEKVRIHMTDFVNETLPPAERGRFISAIGKALRRPDLLHGDPASMYRHAFKVMQAIENRAEVVYKEAVIGDIKTTIKRSLESPTVDIPYQQRIRDAISKIGTTKPIKSTIESMKKLNEHIERLQAAGEEVSAEMLERVSGLSKLPLKDMPIAALESLRTKLALLEKLGRDKVKSRQIAWTREKADRVKAMKDAESTPLEKNPIFKPQPGEAGKITMMQRVANWWNAGGNGFHGFERAIAPMDELYDLLGRGKATYDGWLERNIRGPLDLAFNSEVSESTPIRQKAQEIIDRHKLTDDDLSKVSVHAIAKMEGGKERLAEMGITEDTIWKSETLTDGQREFYQYARGVYDALLPRIQRTAHFLDNKEVKGVENYWPLQRDWVAHAESDVSVPGEMTFDENATSRQVLNDIGAKRLSTKTQQGFTTERVRNAATAVRLNAADIFNRHLTDALHYIHAQPELRMAGQIARSEAFAKKFGKEGQQIILDHLDTIARQGGVNRFQRLAMLDWVRNATSKAQVGFRVASNLVHLSQIPLSVTHAGGPGYWARGLRTALTDEGQAFLRQHAAETTVRSGGEPAQAEVEAISKLGKAGFAVARNIDRLDSQATFLGRYFNEMAKKGVTPEQALKMPIDRNAQMVSLARTRRAVASPLYKDIPQSTSRGLGFGGNVSVARAVNQFRNIFYDNWSNIRHDFFRAGLSDAVKNGLHGDNVSKLAAISAATLMSIAMETGIKYGIKKAIRAGVSAATGVPDKEEDPDQALSDLKHHALNRVPFVGQAVNAAIYGETGVPVIDSLVKPLHEVATAVKSKTPTTKAKHQLRAVGAAATLAGVPGIGQAADVAEQVLVPKVAKKKKNTFTIVK